MIHTVLSAIDAFSVHRLSFFELIIVHFLSDNILFWLLPHLRCSRQGFRNSVSFLNSISFSFCKLLANFARSSITFSTCLLLATAQFHIEAQTTLSRLERHIHDGGMLLHIGKDIPPLLLNSDVSIEGFFIELNLSKNK